LALVVDRLGKVRGSAGRDHPVLQGLSRARPSCAKKKTRRRYRNDSVIQRIDQLPFSIMPPPLSGGIGSRQQKQRLRAPRRRSSPPSRGGCRRSGRLGRPRPSALPRRSRRGAPSRHIIVATHTHTHTEASWAIANDPPLYAHMPLPVLRSHTLGRRPRPPG